MDSRAFLDMLNKSPQPVVIDIWATWCMPCRMIEPALHNLEKKYSGQVKVWKINADDSQDLLRHLGVGGIPTLIAFQRGQEITRTVGAQPQPSLERLFKAALGEEVNSKNGLAKKDRILRVLVGLLVTILGWSLSHSLVFVILGGIVLFSAVYDRCPIYQTVSSRIKSAITRLISRFTTSS